MFSRTVIQLFISLGNDSSRIPMVYGLFRPVWAYSEALGTPRQSTGSQLGARNLANLGHAGCFLRCAGRAVCRKKGCIWQGLMLKIHLVYLAVAGSSGPQPIPVSVYYSLGSALIARWQASWWPPSMGECKD